mgnify:CR=1 FL=1
MPASKNVLKETDYFEQVKLNGGAQLIYRPSFDTPVVSLRAGHLGGARFESEGSFGAAELLSRVWMSGSDQLSEDEINAKMESFLRLIRRELDFKHLVAQKETIMV